MFGYILPDKPNLFVKDYALYRAFYCGLCHQIKHCHGQCMRLGVNYDVTFISIFVHGITGEELKYKYKSCILNPYQRKMVIDKGGLLERCAYLNTLLLYFKSRDDLADKPSQTKRCLHAFLKRKVRLATEYLPATRSLLDEAYTRQQEVEKRAQATWQEAGDPFAEAFSGILKELCGSHYTAEVGEVGYMLAQYVYLLDALDDYDKDCKHHQFNPLYLTYGAATKAELLTQHGEQIKGEITSLIAQINDRYSKVSIVGTEGIITNTLWFGLKNRADTLLNKENHQCQKTHIKF